MQPPNKVTFGMPGLTIESRMRVQQMACQCDQQVAVPELTAFELRV